MKFSTKFWTQLSYELICDSTMRVRDVERTEKMQKMFIRWSSSDDSRLGGDECLLGTCKELTKCTSSAYVTGK